MGTEQNWKVNDGTSIKMMPGQSANSVCEMHSYETGGQEEDSLSLWNKCQKSVYSSFFERKG